MQDRCAVEAKQMQGYVVAMVEELFVIVIQGVLSVIADRVGLIL